MQVKNLEVVAFGSGTVPDGINADVELSDDVTLAVYRSWDEPVWFLYDVEFGESNEGPGRGIYIAGIEDIDRRYTIPAGPITDALEHAVDAIRSSFSLA